MKYSPSPAVLSPSNEVTSYPLLLSRVSYLFRTLPSINRPQLSSISKPFFSFLQQKGADRQRQRGKVMEELSLTVKGRETLRDSSYHFEERSSKTSVFLTNYEVIYITSEAHSPKKSTPKPAKYPPPSPNSFSYLPHFYFVYSGPSIKFISLPFPSPIFYIHENLKQFWLIRNWSILTHIFLQFYFLCCPTTTKQFYKERKSI